MEREKLYKLADLVRQNMVNPDIDIDVCFYDENDPSCKTKATPYLIVKYNANNFTHTKEIDIDKEYWQKDLEDLKNYVMFQVEQFMEEIDSVEFGGE